MEQGESGGIGWMFRNQKDELISAGSKVRNCGQLIYIAELEKLKEVLMDAQRRKSQYIELQQMLKLWWLNYKEKFHQWQMHHL